MRRYITAGSPYPRIVRIVILEGRVRYLIRDDGVGLEESAIAALMVIGILGVFNPFFASDYAAEHGGNYPDWLMLAAIGRPACRRRSVVLSRPR